MLSFQSPEQRATRPPLHHTPTQSSSISSDTTHSVTSWDTQTVVADDEEADDEESDDYISTLNLTPIQRAALSQHKFLPRDVSSKLEPFDTMPIKLDRFAESLVSFYLLQYPAATYVFNQNLNPHPVFTNFSIAMTAPACFQVILARSALYKKSAGRYGTSLERAELDTAIVEHKSNAIHRIRRLSETKDNAGSARKEELVASIISLGTLEMRLGSTESGDVHYSAVRRLLKSIGGPMHIRDLRLNRVMCFFECIYATPRNSYIWDREDLGPILKRFNEYLGDVYEIWKERDGGQDEAGKNSRLEDRAAFPFTSVDTSSTLRSPAKIGTGSKRKPTGPHSPYFGLQPLPEALPLPPSRPLATTQPPPLKAPDGSAPSRMSPSAHDRILKASSTGKRSARPEPRRPPKQRARHTEKQKQKARAMQIDSYDPAKAITVDQSHHATDLSRPRPPAFEATAPAATIPPRAPASIPQHNSPRSNSKQLYWKLHPDSALHQRLALFHELPPEAQEKNLIWDLACLFCLSSIATSPSFAPHSPLSKSSRPFSSPPLHTYMAHLSHIVRTANLHVSENNSNMMWLIQTNDGTSEHSARMWEVASFTWVCKHLNGRVRRRLREWIWGFLCGVECGGREVLTSFDFSYHS